MQGHHESFNWVQHAPVLKDFPNHLIMIILIGLGLIITGLIATIKTKGVQDTTVPDGTLTYRNFFEVLAEKVYELCESIMGEHDAHKHFHFIGSIFLLIFVSNLFGLIPGFLPPTDNVNTTLALGLYVFLYYNFQGFKENGISYLKHFLGPVIFLAPLMFAIEIFSHLARPLSLALRLRGNMMGDHAVLGVFTDLAPYVVPVIFYGLGLFVAFVQAYVFCLLTMVYISMSTAHDH